MKKKKKKKNSLVCGFDERFKDPDPEIILNPEMIPKSVPK